MVEFISMLHFISIHALTGLVIIGTGAALSWLVSRTFMNVRQEGPALLPACARPIFFKPGDSDRPDRPFLP